MKSTPLISVIIPCFNVEEHIQKAISSIISQSYKNLEIWVVDDASSDDTLNRINEIKDERIKVLAFKENTQKIGAVNEVLKKVTGDYIAFQDGDDWSEPSRIEKQLAAFKNDPNLGICFTAYNKVGEKIINSGQISSTDSELKDEFLFFGNRKMTHLNPTVCATMLISKQVVEEIDGYHPYFKGRVGEDIYWVHKILRKFNGVCINEPLYNYLQRNDSLTGLQLSGLNPKAAYSWQLLEMIINKSIAENMDVLDEENSDLLRRMELEACEVALADAIKRNIDLKNSYENSRSYRIGRKLVSIFSFLKS